MDYLANFKFFAACILVLSFSSCKIYTEKRSEELSQAVFATSDSIDKARFDLAYNYSRQAERLAFPPKKRIQISEIVTRTGNSTSSVKKIIREETKVPNLVAVTTTEQNEGNRTVLRLVVPDHLRNAELLVENSEEWNTLLETKEFANQLKTDYSNLQTLTSNIDAELQKQTIMNNQMVVDLNNMQKKLLEKDLAILQRNVLIAILILTIAGGVYLRIKGIL